MGSPEPTVLIEDVRDEVEHAIRERLHVRVRATPPSTQALRWPQSIDGDAIVMRDSDCGLARAPYRWTPAQWREAVGTGDRRNLWRQVGFWDFAHADDPAGDEIRFAHQRPQWAGEELHRLRRENDELRKQLAVLKEGDR